MLAVLAVPALRSTETPIWGWVLFVVFVDVAHVWSSLFRTYLDPDEFARRRELYLTVPVAAWLAGVVLHGLGALLFWRALAYLAVFHFVRQQYGFVRIYRHRAGETGSVDRRLDQAAIYATMLYPLVFWHADPDRPFAWFVEGDFVGLPAWTAAAAVWLYASVLGAFLVRQAWWAARGAFNPGKVGVVLSTAATWFVGIVLLDSDFAFTITNVVAHGVPYMALVWLYGNRKWAGDPSWRRRIHRPGAALVFLGSLFALAWFEEGLWDLLVWREHGAVFGGLSPDWTVPPALLTLVVPLLALPQATHYVLDAWIWRFDGSNPDLRRNLLGDPR